MHGHGTPAPANGYDEATPAPAGAGTRQKVWDALHSVSEPANTIQLANVAGVGKSTAGKVLAAWGGAGIVVRHSGSEGTAGRARWSLPVPAGADDEHATTPGDAVVEQGDAPGPENPSEDPTAEAIAPEADASRESTMDRPAPGIAESSGCVGAKRARLPKGVLRGWVEQFLIDNAGEHGPHAIAQHLGRSSGAVANALEKLLGAGTVVRVCDRPRRYAAKLDDTETG